MKSKFFTINKKNATQYLNNNQTNSLQNFWTRKKKNKNFLLSNRNLIANKNKFIYSLKWEKMQNIWSSQFEKKLKLN